MELSGGRFLWTIVSQPVVVFPMFKASFKKRKGINIGCRSWMKGKNLMNVLHKMEIFVNVVPHRFCFCLHKYGHTYFPIWQQT